MNDVCSDSCKLKCLVSDYIKKLYMPEDEAVSAIADLIGDLHKDKKLTVNYILNQDDFESLVFQLFRLLKASLPIIVGNTAYILGTLAEFEEGRSKIVHILSLDSDKCHSFDLLISLLDSDDSETLLNVAGTIGSLVESSEGRQYILSQSKCFLKLLDKITHLLQSTDLWIASNAALIIARVTIDDVGNSYILSSSLLNTIIVNLINSLAIDNAGRGMNAAFALGRIFDKGSTIVTYYSIIYKLKFIEKLIKITGGSEMSFVKNSCFCLSSIMSSDKGFDLVIADSSFNELLINLEKLLSLDDDDETIWFSVLTLKIISKKPIGCKLLRKSKNVWYNVKKCLYNVKLSNEVKNECQEIINNLSPIEKPPKPNVTLISPYEVLVSWKYPKAINEFEFKSYLYYKQDEDEILFYRGKKEEISVKSLEPNTNYQFYLKFANQIEISMPSDTCTILTAEDFPSEPTNMRVITCTSTQIKIGWDEPLKMNGVIKHYLISMNNKNIEQTSDRTSIISGLQPNTIYSFSVCAVNSCGKGKCGEIEASTLTTGAHAPDKPNVIMLGRSEANLSWNPPEAIMGKIFRYDVKINQKKIVYSGINTYCKISNLKPDTEYTFSVVVVTSDGKYESPISRKRSGKDEYISTHRTPLYESKVKSDSFDNTSPQRTLSSTNSLNNSSKFQKSPFVTLNRQKSEFSSNLKPLNIKSVENLNRVPQNNISSSENLKSKENIIDPSTKLQNLVSNKCNVRPQKTKSWGGNVSNVDNYTNSISIPSMSSVSLDIAPQASKDSSDTFVTNVKSGNKSESEKTAYNKSCALVSRCQFRKVSIKSNGDFAKPSCKTSFSMPKNFYLQKQPSTTYR